VSVSRIALALLLSSRALDTRAAVQSDGVPAGATGAPGSTADSVRLLPALEGAVTHASTGKSVATLATFRVVE
jgi:hypothetical protein